MNDQELTVQDVKDAEREGLEEGVLHLVEQALEETYDYLNPGEHVLADRYMFEKILSRFRIRLEPREDEQR